ncbi:MAG TPA: response regulator [Bryobacteraceae bacterium]|nr:response regulator [Bryobacteraceae bacterium]
MALRVYLVDDEPLALKGLTRLLKITGRVEIAGAATDPRVALEFLSNHEVDAVFLDVQMPGLTGFELLARLPSHPLVVFTTAFDRFALNAFEVNSVDYLLKPIEPRHLDRALGKLERILGSAERAANRDGIRSLIAELSHRYPTRIASRTGDRVTFTDLSAISHFYSKDGLTFAAAGTKDVIVDTTIAELEQRLDPEVFLRVHRGAILNLTFIDEVSRGFAGGLNVRLKDGRRTSLPVARDRVRNLKTRLGF